MLSLFRSKTKADRNIILDIQSGLVRGALVEYGGDGPARILRITTQSIPSILAPTDSQRITKKILKIVFDVTSNLLEDYGDQKISGIDYILSSPWVMSELKTIKVTYEFEKEITKDIITKIVSDEVKKNENSLDMIPLEQNIFEIRLNGYVVSSYKGKEAHSLEISLSTSFGSKIFLDKLHDVVGRVVEIKHHKCHSALLMQYTALRSILEDNKEYVYIHIHSELTDIIIVKNGLCKHISSFPFGITSLLRKMANSMNQGIAASDSLLTLYQGDKLTESEKNNTKKIITPLLNAWSAMCIKSLTGSFDIINIPRTVLMSAHSHFDLFKEAMLFQNDLNLDIISYKSVIGEDKIVTDKGLAQSELMKMYMLALGNMI